jgi:hypothetical protein
VLVNDGESQRAKDFGAVLSKTTRHLLLEFDHTKIMLSLIVVKRNLGNQPIRHNVLFRDLGILMREEIIKLVRLGVLPSGADADIERIKHIQALLADIKTPISDQEAEELVKIFGNDDCFGLAWTIIHLIETAPSWPIQQCLMVNPDNEWITLLKKRARVS